MGVKHPFVSGKADGGDATLVRPSDWNAPHTIEDFALPADISPAQLVADTHDWNPTGLSTAAVIRLSTDATRNLTGITGGADGRVLVLMNIGSFDCVLKYDSASSAAANRFFCPSLTDYTLKPSASVVLVYDSTSLRWRVVGLPIGAPTDAGYLVTTADPALNNETVVGSAPGGELGGTWASPTVDATHSGSAHHAQSHVLTGADHTASGLTTGHVLTATSATAFAFQAAAGGGPVLISGNSGAANSAAAPSETWQILTADSAVLSTLATVMTTQSLPAGTYLFEYFVVWRSATATAGATFVVDATGTVTRFRATRHLQTTGAAAATGVSDGEAQVPTGSLVEHMSTRADAGSLGPNTGVDTINVDQFDMIRGIVVTSTSGDLLLRAASELGTNVTVKADTLLLLKRLA